MRRYFVQFTPVGWQVNDRSGIDHRSESFGLERQEYRRARALAARLNGTEAIVEGATTGHGTGQAVSVGSGDCGASRHTEVDNECGPVFHVKVGGRNYGRSAERANTGP